MGHRTHLENWALCLAAHSSWPARHTGGRSGMSAAPKNEGSDPGTGARHWTHALSLGGPDLAEDGASLRWRFPGLPWWFLHTASSSLLRVQECRYGRAPAVHGCWPPAGNILGSRSVWGTGAALKLRSLSHCAFFLTSLQFTVLWMNYS